MTTAEHLELSAHVPLGSLATAAVPVARAGETAGEVRVALAGRRFDSAAAVVLLDGDRLTGIVTLEALLAARADVPVDTIMDREPPILEPDGDQERAAWTMVAAGESALAVADGRGRFAGSSRRTACSP